MDDAEEAKEQLNSKPLDEDSMGFLEEDIRKLVVTLRSTPPKVKFQTHGNYTLN